jgi:transcriptional activator protein Pur-alpha
VCRHKKRPRPCEQLVKTVENEIMGPKYAKGSNEMHSVKYLSLSKISKNKFVLRMQESEELASRMVMVESKRFHVDLKKNSKGLFIKIAETHRDSQKEKIILPIAGAAKFSEILAQMKQKDSSIPVSDNPADAKEPLASERLKVESKMFFFDLRENPKGRFLRISQIVSQRTSVIIPITGVLNVRDAIVEILRDQPIAGVSVDGDSISDMSAGQDLSVEKKGYQFEVKSNERGSYLRITETVGRTRSSVNLPQSGWQDFLNALKAAAAHA